MGEEEDKKSAEGEQKSAEENNETPDMIARANFAAERLEKANAEQKILLARQEKILADAKLQGRSITGKQEEPKVETEKEYAARMLRGGK
jgi:hypothetical protein